MKKIVIYYSLEGHTKFIANTITKELNCDILELNPEKEISKTGFKRYLQGAKSIMLHEKPILKNKIPDLSEYDSIIIGTPIWAGTFASPINTFVSENKISDKNIAFFACHAGGGAKKCFKKLEGIFKDNKIIGKIDFNDSESETDKEIKVKKWITETFNI